MNEFHKSSSHVQMQAEELIFGKVEKILCIKLDKNPKLYLAENAFTYIQPDFYSEEANIIGEIFSHVGKPKKAQDNKIANDILKMLLLEKITGKKFRKIIAVCDESEKKKLQGKSALAESIRQFNVEIMYIEMNEDMRKQIAEAQELQKMTNA